MENELNRDLLSDSKQEFSKSLRPKSANRKARLLSQQRVECMVNFVL